MLTGVQFAAEEYGLKDKEFVSVKVESQGD